MDLEQISKVLQQAGVVLEREYLPTFLDSISIDVDKTYDYFHKNNLTYRADQFGNPTLEELRHTTKFIIESSKKKSAMIGEIGGQLEADAAQWGKEQGNPKPVVGFIAGETAPKGRTMGHAGAIVGGSDDTAQAKKRIMASCGIHVVDSPASTSSRPGKAAAALLTRSR